ncbi:MAG: serine O-acetyltransferase [Bacteroidales bacterium]|jgi:serine O-acetyltransferase|nr:serine acetyltransferase [Bacteroidales bacterium]
MDSIIQADLYRYGRLTGRSGLLKGWLDPGFRYMFLYRKVQKHKRWTIRGLYYRILKRIFTYHGYQINSDASIAGGFQLYHRGTVIIGPVIIGKNCSVSHNVTIGRSYRGGQLGRPTIGDFVWIGTGAVVVGKIRIGNDVLIAPNCFVNFDVPDNSLVIGNPGKIIHKINPTKNYIKDVLL